MAFRCTSLENLGVEPNVKFNLKNRFIKFLAVGVLNTIFGYSSFALILAIGVHYSLANLMATVLGVLFNFKTTGRLVFNNSNNRLIFKFFGVYAIIYLLGTGALYLANMYHANLYITGALLTLPMAVISFSLNKFFVFKA